MVGCRRDVPVTIQPRSLESSGELGLRSRSTPDNLVLLCPSAHFAKTLHGPEWRPVLLAWIEQAEREAD
jgi:hypothetical protein